MIDKFLESIPLKLTGIFNPKLECKALRETSYNGNVKLVFKLPLPMRITDLRDAFDSAHGLVQMYHYVPDYDTTYGHTMAFFHSPESQPMFWLTCSTDGTGKVNVIDVELFSSLEMMVAKLRRELQFQDCLPGTFEYRISEGELISYFL